MQKRREKILVKKINGLGKRKNMKFYNEPHSRHAYCGVHYVINNLLGFYKDIRSGD